VAALVTNADKSFIKHHNCILLESMKVTKELDGELVSRKRKDWHRNIDMAFSTQQHIYNGDKFTDLLLPVKIDGRWALLIVQLGELKLVVVVFDDWDPMEYKFTLEAVGHAMKSEALDI
jgi:hypothetical protein